jgi:predicted nucleic acid-binding protein
MMVVSNTSPMTSLAAISQIDLLRSLYGTVIIPQAVYDELTSLPDQPGGAEARSFSWILTRQASDRKLVESLLAELDQGEAEAIALALESPADLLLIDERIGRAVAQRFELKVTGTVGVLVEAKHQGLIVAVKPILDDLIDRGRFRVSASLYRAVLVSVGETS